MKGRGLLAFGETRGKKEMTQSDLYFGKITLTLVRRID